jgi:hypothetical protein
VNHPTAAGVEPEGLRRTLRKLHVWEVYEFTGRTRAIAVISLCFVMLIAWNIGVALLPHKVQYTYLEGVERSSGVKPFGTPFRKPIPFPSEPVH